MPFSSIFWTHFHEHTLFVNLRLRLPVVLLLPCKHVPVTGPPGRQGFSACTTMGVALNADVQ